MKFLLDKTFSPKTRDYLQSLSYNVVRVDDVLGEQVDDETIFNHARENDFVIITGDFDFGEILHLSKSNKPSTIILKISNRRVPNVNTKLSEILPEIIPSLGKGVIVMVEDYRIRIRDLPIK